ncbi:MAG: 6,7-dimethyl-8-ribityllumazine synthase [Proteobacteria bacterium]|nr:6,7-dimethyl-8-ribityllumazine synthase [Pseudomonadota bacterium]
MSKYHLVEGKQRLDSATITIVASRFNNFVVESLLDACLATLKKSGLQDQDITVVRVPGAFEIPSTVQHVIKHTTCDAVITLGAVIRGETPHFDYICSECIRGLGQISLENDTPVIFGVLTVDNTEQAMDRAGEEESNKGAESAQAAIEMINIFRALA